VEEVCLIDDRCDELNQSSCLVLLEVIVCEKTRRQNAKRQKPTWEISQNLLLERTSWKIAMRRYV